MCPGESAPLLEGKWQRRRLIQRGQSQKGEGLGGTEESGGDQQQLGKGWRCSLLGLAPDALNQNCGDGPQSAVTSSRGVLTCHSPLSLIGPGWKFRHPCL